MSEVNEKKPETAISNVLATNEIKPNKSRVTLTPAQEKLLEVLRDARSLTMTVAAIVAEAGVSRQTYYDAFEDDNFTVALEAAIQNHLRASEFRVIHNIIEKATDQKVTSHHWGQMVLRMRGRLEEQSRKPALVQVVFTNVVRPKVEVAPGKVVVENEVEEDE